MPNYSALLLSAFFAFAEQGGADEPIDVRVGVVAYQDSSSDIARFQRQLAELAAASPRPIQVRVAFGTYGDVLHWMNRKYVDVAVMSPGIFVESLTADSATQRWRYLATLGLQAAESPLAGDERRKPGYHYQYASVSVVAADATIRDTASLRHAAEQGRVQFLFVHPLSVSGSIAPQYALRQIGIHPRAEDVQYTYSHSNSLRLVSEPLPGKERIAFVWDDAPALPPERAARIRKLDFPELESLSVPQNTVAARPDFEHAELVTDIMLRHVDDAGHRDFEKFDDWAERYGTIGQWSKAIDMQAGGSESQGVSLDELGSILVHSVRSQPNPLRIALVLSGGGAKCAYQVGAVAAVEEKLEELRRTEDEPNLDIGLVVGTSGGAINALPIALGISANPDGREELRNVWGTLDQRDIVRPSKLVRLNMGLWLVSLQSLVVLWLVRRFGPAPERRAATIAGIFIALALSQLVLAYMRWSPWWLLGDGHLLHHAWLWSTFGLAWSAWCMLGLGVAGMLAQLVLRRRGSHLEGPRTLVRWLLLVGLVGLPGIQLATIFFYERTLTDGTGIEHALAAKLPALVDSQLARQGTPALPSLETMADADRLRQLSRRVIEDELLRRDLVLTGSCVSKTTAELPSDLYFYAAARGSRSNHPSFGRSGVPLREYPELLVDVVMGSGSIYPVFPPRTLLDFPRAGERVELVDGGFSHNSPIEAAVLWGATHIILIEASASAAERRGRRNFLQNSIDAFNHLYYQAQLADARSKEKVTIFAIRPQPPHICVLDFANNLVERAIGTGYRDARGQARTETLSVVERPSWEKSLGEPVFLRVSGIRD
jgi:predicted acylesterase/phospholipase RssA/ABC-type phosphate/phosphonate transport system substrate-binding protein